MRRALLLATLLCTPLLGVAQTATPAPGTITFTNTDADPSAATINLPECTGSNTVEISWTATGAAVPGMTYTLYASNKANSTNNFNTALDCDKVSDASQGLTVISVGSTLTGQSSLSVIDQPYSTSTIASALGAGACSLQADTQIFLCVQAQVGGADIGNARGIITLSLAGPSSAPVLDAVLPGNQALNVAWSDPNSPVAAQYAVAAVSLADPTTIPTAAAFDPTGGWSGFDPRDGARHLSGFVTATTNRLGGLQNDVTYAVAVFAYSASGTASDPSNVMTGTPQLVYDFWQAYRNAGGKETGGCSSGFAGPVGLGLLLATLALVRRRK